MDGYAKVYRQILESSLASNYELRHFFTDLLLICDRRGRIDKTYEAIARELGIPLEKVIGWIRDLSASDYETRSQVQDGARLVPIDPDRAWGWKIVNHALYRGLEQRRLKWRERKRRQRARKKSHSVLPGPGESRDVTGCPPGVTPLPGEMSRGVTPGHAASPPVPLGHAVSTDLPGDQNQNHNQNQNQGERVHTNGAVDLDQVKWSLSLLSKEAFGRTFEAYHWSTETEKLVKMAMPLTMADLELLAWFYRIPEDHEIFGVTYRRQSFGSVLENLVSEVQKVRRARKNLGLSEELEEGVAEKNSGPDGWEEVAHELYPRMHFPESFWDITSPEVQERIRERITG